MHEFEMVTFWTLSDFLDLVSTKENRVKVSRWLRQAEVITRNPGGVSVVEKARIAEVMPWLLEQARVAMAAKKERPPK